MFDGLFLINSTIDATHAPGLTVFNTQERFNQLIETLDSIDKHCPNSVKIVFDMSPKDVSEEYQTAISSRENTWFIDMGKHEYVQIFSYNALRSQAETYAMMGLLDWLETQDIVAKRIYKISGRYTLNDNFILNDDRYKDAFVFSESIPSWMDKDTQDRVGVNRLFRLRLWHMDFNLLNAFHKELSNIFEDCSTHRIDIEHSYYKNLHDKYKIVEVPKKIGRAHV